MASENISLSKYQRLMTNVNNKNSLRAESQTGSKVAKQITNINTPKSKKWLGKANENFITILV